MDIPKIIQLINEGLPAAEKIVSTLAAIGAFIGAWYAKGSADRNNKNIKQTQTLLQTNTNITADSQSELKKLQAYVTKVQTKHAQELSEANRKIQALSDELHILRRQLTEEDTSLEPPTKIDI